MEKGEAGFNVAPGASAIDIARNRNIVFAGQPLEAWFPIHNFLNMPGKPSKKPSPL
jgi:hypothetical protein